MKTFCSTARVLPVLPLLGFLFAVGFAETANAAELKELGRWSGFPDWVTSVQFSPNGKTLAAGSYDVVKLRDVESQKETATLQVRGGFNHALAFSPDGSQLAIGTYQRIDVWDVANAKRFKQLKGSKGYVRGLIWNGERLVSAGEDGHVRVWNAGDGALVNDFQPVEQPILGLALAPEGNAVAIACGDENRLSKPGQVAMLSLESGEILKKFDSHELPVLCAAFANEGKLLLSGGIDEHVNLNDVESGETKSFFGGHSRPVNAVCPLPGTPLVVSGSGGRFKGKNELRVWQLSDGTNIADVEAHEQPISSVAVNADGLIAAGSRDKSVSLWRVEGTATDATSEATVVYPVPTTYLVDTEKKPLIRVGVIGLDTSHSIAFTKAFNSDSPNPQLDGMRVVAAYPYGSRKIESSMTRIPGYTEEMKKLGVEITESIAELLEKVDCVLLETNDGHPHLEQVREVIAAGKPVFVDKPIAGSLKDCLEIFKLAEEKGVPLFSSSSLRFMEGAQQARKGEWGQITGCDAYSPCSLEETHPDLFWYGIHGVEILFTVMGPDVETVTRASQEGTDVVVGVWKDGRIGTFRGIRSGKGGYGGTAFSDKGTNQLAGFSGYVPLIVEIAEFFRTGEPPVTKEETIAIYAFMEAADESKRRGGVPVSIQEVLEQARNAPSSK
ncbi:MAG: Gfo/Idh/MocA family oxidoreductase [Planctomycetaceae bacterium]|nr:Gfo/Idh/MocA family oxidoreductase [Planctomycetaceae bacterium]